MLTPLILRVVPTQFLPVLVADYVAAHFALYGLLTIGGLRLVEPALWRGLGNHGGVAVERPLLTRARPLLLSSGSAVRGGEWRRVQRAKGYQSIIVNGEETFADGACTGATPGRLLRHGRG